MLAVFCLTIAVVTTVVAQNSFAYQAVIRNAKGELVTNQEISMRFSLVYDGNVVYSETHKTTTNQYGNVQVNVGEGTRTSESGKFADVPWSSMKVMMKIEADPKGGSNYIDLGTIQLQPAPYAMYAPAAGAVNAIQAGEPKSDGDALFEVKDKNGNVVFAVYRDGVRVFVDDADSTKAMATGFAVAGRRAAKDGEEADIFSVTAEGTQVFVSEEDTAGGKPMATGFAVAGRRAAKDMNSDLFTVNSTGTQIYINNDVEAGKPMATGFAVAGRRAAKDDTTGSNQNDKYLEINADGTRVYIDDDSADNSDKPIRTGFAVAGRRAAKGDSGSSRKGSKYMEINADGTQIYVGDEGGKPMATGFAVAGRRAAKGENIKLFEVNSYGTQIYIETSGKAMRTGFAVAGRRAAKDGVTNKYLVIDADGTCIYVDYEEAKAMQTGFAVAGRRAAKDGTPNTILSVDNVDGTRAYIDDVDGKAMATGFAVAGRRAAKEGEKFMSINKDTVKITTTQLEVQSTEIDEAVLIMNGGSTKITTDLFVLAEKEGDEPLLSADNSGVDVSTNVVVRGDVTQAVESEALDLAKPILMTAINKIDTLDCASAVTELGEVKGYRLLKIYGNGLFALPQTPDADGNSFILFDADGNIASTIEDAFAAVVMTNPGTTDAKVLVWPLKQRNSLNISFGVTTADSTKQYVRVDAIINSGAGVEGKVEALAAEANTGSVEIEGRTVYGNIITLTAKYAGGYSFKQWSDGNDANPRTLRYVGTAAFTAMFDVNTYKIIVEATDGGSVDGDGTYKHGDEVTLTATADEHYHFVNWNNNPALNNEVYKFKAESNDTLTATFELNSHTVAYVIGNDTVEIDTVAYGVTIPQPKKQTADEGYNLVWELPEAMPMPDEPITVLGRLEAIEYTITFVDESGNVLYETDFEYNTTPVYEGEALTKESTAQYDFEFDDWTPSISEVKGDATYTATFSSKLRSYAVTASANQADYGEVTVSGTQNQDGTYNYGTQITLEAKANQGYKFAYWQDDETNKSETRTVTVSGAVTYTAVFEELPYYAFILPDGLVLVGEIPTPNGEGKYVSGTVLRFAVVDGYTLIGEVTDNKNKTYTATEGVYTLNDGDVEISADVAKFHIVTFNAGSGTFSDGKSTKEIQVRDNSQILADDIPTASRAGYSLYGWGDDEGQFDFTQQITADNITLTANWLPDEFTKGELTMTFADEADASSSHQIQATYVHYMSADGEYLYLRHLIMIGDYPIYEYRNYYIVDGKIYEDNAFVGIYDESSYMVVTMPIDSVLQEDGELNEAAANGFAENYYSGTETQVKMFEHDGNFTTSAGQPSDLEELLFGTLAKKIAVNYLDDYFGHTNLSEIRWRPFFTLNGTNITAANIVNKEKNEGDTCNYEQTIIQQNGYYYRQTLAKIKTKFDNIREGFNIRTDYDCGTVEVSDNKTHVDFGEVVTLTAKPNDKKIFAGWVDNNTENPRTVRVTDAASVKAVFIEPVIYVSSENINYANNGYSETAPVPSIAEALKRIPYTDNQENWMDWEIRIMGTLEGSQSLESEPIENDEGDIVGYKQIAAKSITIIGNTGLDEYNQPQDMIDGGWRKTVNEYGYETWKNDDENADPSSALTIRNVSAPVIIKNLAITGGYVYETGGGMYVESSSKYATKVTIDDGTVVRGNKALYGGGVYVYSNSYYDGNEVENGVAEVTMNGGIIGGNSDEDANYADINTNTGIGGGGVLVYGDSAKFSMKGGSIKNNLAAGGGAGVCVYDGALFEMEAGTIEANRTTEDSWNGYGGGVLIKYNSKFIMKGGSISNNQAFREGGGVHVSRGTLEMSGESVISGNHASTGGGVYLNSSSTLTMAGGNIIGNVAYEGCGVYLESTGTINMSNTAVIDANNDVCLSTSTTINVGKFNFANENADEKTKVAIITPQGSYWQEETYFIGESSEFDRFDVTPVNNEGKIEFYTITNEGKLQKREDAALIAVYYDYSETSQRSELKTFMEIKPSVDGYINEEDLPDPSKTDDDSSIEYVFDGWYVKDEDGYSKFDFDQEITTTTVLYGMFSAETTVANSQAQLADIVKNMDDPLTDYTIYIDKSLSGPQVIAQSDGHKLPHSITLYGELEDGIYGLHGGWGRPEGEWEYWGDYREEAFDTQADYEEFIKQPVLTIQTKAPIYIKNLIIGGGYSTGICVSGTDNQTAFGSITLGNGAVVENNGDYYGNNGYFDKENNLACIGVDVHPNANLYMSGNARVNNSNVVRLNVWADHNVQPQINIDGLDGESDVVAVIHPDSYPGVAYDRSVLTGTSANIRKQCGRFKVVPHNGNQYGVDASGNVAQLISVTFKDGGKELTDLTQYVASGSYATEPQAPIKIGYTLTGWYNPVTKQLFNFSETQITEELQLEAEWDTWMIEEGGHYFVDLGTGDNTLWATTNVGAENAWDFGYYLAWGETEPRFTSNGGTVTWKSEYPNGYNAIASNFVDAATAWCTSATMPTTTQIQALINNCYWVWTSDYNQTGTAGFIVYKLKDGDTHSVVYSNPSTAFSLADVHIFLPAAGYYAGKTFKSGVDYYTNYLTSDYYNDGSNYYAYCLTMNGPKRASSGLQVLYTNAGSLVRAVTQAQSSNTTFNVPDDYETIGAAIGAIMEKGDPTDYTINVSGDFSWDEVTISRNFTTDDHATLLTITGADANAELGNVNIESNVPIIFSHIKIGGKVGNDNWDNNQNVTFEDGAIVEGMVYFMSGTVKMEDGSQVAYIGVEGAFIMYGGEVTGNDTNYDGVKDDYVSIAGFGTFKMSGSAKPHKVVTDKITIDGALSSVTASDKIIIVRDEYSEDDVVLEVAGGLDFSVADIYGRFELGHGMYEIESSGKIRKKKAGDTTLYVGGQDCYGNDSEDEDYIGNGTANYPFATLQQAFVDMTSEAEYTIVLKGDLTKEQSIWDFGLNLVPKATKITIDGKYDGVSHAIKGEGMSGDSPALYISTEQKQIPVVITNLTIEGCDVSSGNQENGGGLYVGEGAQVTLGENTVITNNTAMAGGGVYNCGSLTITSNAQISSNTAYAGGGIYNCDGSTLTMSGGTISGGFEGMGGAVYVDGGSNFNISGSAYIPVGENNDVYLNNEDVSVMLTITGDLSSTETPVVTITPADYTKQVATGSALSGNRTKIGVTTDGEGKNYEVGEDGKLQQKQ